MSVQYREVREYRRMRVEKRMIDEAGLRCHFDPVEAEGAVTPDRNRLIFRSQDGTLDVRVRSDGDRTVLDVAGLAGGLSGTSKKSDRPITADGTKHPADAVASVAQFFKAFEEELPGRSRGVQLIPCGVCGYLSCEVVSGRCPECADVFVTHGV